MGVLSELVVAPKSDAAAVAESNSPSQDWNGIVWKGLDPIKLASLWCILLGEQFQVANVVARSQRIELAAEASEDGPWVFAIPEDLRNLLAKLAGESEGNIHIVARAWAATDDLVEWDYSDVASLLHDVIDLADGASLEGRNLLLWMCL